MRVLQQMVKTAAAAGQELPTPFLLDLMRLLFENTAIEDSEGVPVPTAFLHFPSAHFLWSRRQ